MFSAKFCIGSFSREFQRFSVKQLLSVGTAVRSGVLQQFDIEEREIIPPPDPG